MNISLLILVISSFAIAGDNILEESHKLLCAFQDTYLHENPEKIEYALATTISKLIKLTTINKLSPKKKLIITCVQLENFTAAAGTFYRERNEDKFKGYLKNSPQNNILALYAYLNQHRLIMTDFEKNRNEFLQIGYLISKDSQDIQKNILSMNKVSNYLELVTKSQNRGRNLSILKCWGFINNSLLSIAGLMSSCVFSLYIKNNSFEFIPDAFRFGGMIFGSVLGFSLLLKSRFNTLDYAAANNRLNEDVIKYNKLSAIANKSQDFRQLFYPLAYMWKIADFKLSDGKIENRNLFFQCASEIAKTLN